MEGNCPAEADRGSLNNQSISYIKPEETEMQPMLKKIIFGSLMAFSFAFETHAATFNVTSTLDTNDMKPGDGICRDTRGRCTLRAAVEETNALKGSDIIRLTAENYILKIPGTGEQYAATGDLDILDNLSITGITPSRTIIDGAGIDRVFHITKSGLMLNLSQLAIIGGDALISKEKGGAIRNNGSTVNLKNVTVQDNVAVNGAGIFSETGSTSISNSTIKNNISTGGGGGVLALAGSLFVSGSHFDQNSSSAGGAIASGDGSLCTINKTTFTNNISTDSGGALSCDGLCQVHESVFSGNVAELFAGAIINHRDFYISNSTIDSNEASLVHGGGIVNRAGNMTIMSSTISNNITPDGNGGGLFNEWEGSEIKIVNSTFSGNQAQFDGGAIRSTSGVTNIYNSTITDNEALRYTGGVMATDSGASTPEYVKLYNTIVADNISGSIFVDCYGGTMGMVQSGGYNLLGDVADCFFVPQSTDLVGDSTTGVVLTASLLPLSNNGGLTETHALSATSLAIDQGDPTGCTDGTSVLLSDQRGTSYARTLDGNSDGVSVCDIGSYEL